MSDYKVETIVIGAGAVGLAIAETLINSGREVILIEAEDDFGKITSSRNSGVIHAGVYYSENSLKSKFCVEGNKLLYNYCKKDRYVMTKLIYIKIINKLKIFFIRLKSGLII